MLKKTISLIISFLLFINIVYAEELNINSDKYILYNMNDNEVLLEHNQDVRTSIASLTKIMTVLVAIENNDDYSKEITITKDMIGGIARDVSTYGFKEGQVVTIDDLLYASLLRSAADAVNSLGVVTSGSLDAFIDLMNQKVNDLGLENTHFTNAIGLYNENNYSTASDTAKILIYALQNEKFKEVFLSHEHELSTGGKVSRTIDYYNKKLGFDLSYVTGAKTGHIKASGYCLASTATLNDVNYLLITLNAYGDSTAHLKDANTIYTYYADNYGYKEIVNENDIVTTIKTKFAKEKSIDVKAGVNYKKYMSNDFDKSKVTFVYDGPKEVMYDISGNKKLSNVKVLYDGEEVYNFDVMFNNKLTFDLLSYLLYYKYYVIGGFSIIVITLVLIIVLLIRKNRKK